MRVCGIIAEYDPFHLGHLHHLRAAREQTRADHVVCVISTAFTQRGLPGMFSTCDRARMALEAGADLVLGMPVSWSCAQANRFAMGGIGILHGLGVVTHVAFGAEPDALPWLKGAADELNAPSAAFQQRFKQALSEGHSIAAAQGMALAQALPEADAARLNSPNFTLGVCYLQALRAMGSGIHPVAVPRVGSYHDTGLKALASATAVREAVMRGDWQGVRRSVPDSTWPLLIKSVKEGELHLPDALDKPLLERLLFGGAVASVPEVTEGLDRRIQAMAALPRSREELVTLVKTRRYTRGRIQRALSGAMLGLTGEAPALPPYARLLGMRRGAEPLLKAIKANGFPLVDRPARESSPCVRQDMRAEQLWCLGAGLPAARAWQHKMPII